MKQYLLTIIAVLAAIILALFSLDTANNQYSTRSYRTYSYNPAPNAWNGAGDGMLSVLQEDNTGSAVAPLSEANATAGSLSALPEAGSPLGAPPAILEVSAMMELTPVQLPPLDAGMVNVTGGLDGNAQTAGYRVNPRSGEFAIAVPYDPSLLPQGFTEDDIQTYVYDRQYHRWVAIQRDSVNEAELLVCSRFRPWEKGLPHTQNDMTNPQDALAQVQDMMSFAPQGEGGGDSPLDFINAVLKTPEMPETSAYTPTSIKELKAADPLEGLTLMQPPTANNSGTANLSYPIEIPAGRQGMQPNLALTYSSGSGNGWLGVGWDISIPSITVETRWGVPRYDQDKESEVYVYEGEQLVTKDGSGNFRPMPHRTNQWTNRSVLGNVEQFYPRKNEAFDSIVRHGSVPSEYWWSVTHRNGVTDYYGKRHGTATVNHSSVLCDPSNHNIAQWMLTESVDPSGNWVRYYYSTESRKSVTGTSINYGTQVYLDSIVYTGHDSLSGKYSVRFNRHNTPRRDIITNGRYGFREVTAVTLCNVEVLYRDTILRRYYFVTENNRESNFKTRLTDIVRMDPPILSIPCDSIFNAQYWVVADSEDVEGSFGKFDLLRYNFSYFDYPDSNSLFSNTVNVNLNDDYIRSTFDDYEHESSALGATSSKDWSVGGTVCFGLGADVSNTRNSIGGNFTYSRSRSKGLLTLIDIDGDGRADKVYKRGRNVYYKKNIADDEYHFHYDDEEIELEGVSDFLDVVGNTPSFGIQGNATDFTANASVPVSISDTKVYFADVNADGLPDLVTDKGVYFNNLDENGYATFTSEQTMLSNSPVAEDSSFIVSSAFGTCGGIIYDGYVNENILCDIDYGIVTNRIDKINDSTLNSMIEWYMNNGYMVLDYTDSTITYRISDTIQTVVDCTPLTNEPDLDAVRVWVAPQGGYIELTSAIELVEDESESAIQSQHIDGVICAVQYNSNMGINGYSLSSDAPVIIREDTLDFNDFNSYSKNNPNFYLKKDTFYVGYNDVLFFRLKSRQSRIADRVLWQQNIRFLYGNATYNSESDFVLTGSSRFQAPKKGTVSVTGNLKRLNSSSYSNYCKLYIVKNNTIKDSMPLGLNSTSIPVNTTFSVNANDTVVMFLLTTNPYMDWGNVSFIPELRFTPDVTDNSMPLEDEITCYPAVIRNITFDTYSPTRDSLRYWFGSLYKGWGQFAYNNNFPNSANLPIDVTRLVIPSVVTGDATDFNQTNLDNTVNANNYSIDTTNAEDPTASMTMEEMAADFDNLYNPLSDNTSWVAMIYDGEHEAYAGFGNTTFITREGAQNTRQTVEIPYEDDDTDNDYDENGNLVTEIPEYDDVLPVGPDGSMLKHVRKRSVSTMVNLGAGWSGGPNLSASLSLGANIISSDYTDLNGDRYPDIMVKNSVQYTRPWGGVDTNVSTLLLEDKHSSKSFVYSFGNTAGGGYPDPYKEEKNSPPTGKIAFRGASASGSYVHGGDNITLLFVDINGDGLPDQIWGEKNKVSLNTGYGFETSETWDIPNIRKGKSNSFSRSGGTSFSYNQYSIGAGIGKSGAENHNKTYLMDFNGDGLPDHVEVGWNKITVRYNYGNGNWSEGEEIHGVQSISQSVSFSKSGNIDFTLGFPMLSFKFTAGVQVSPINKSFTTDVAQLTDINGDGYPDYVTSVSELSMNVKYNTAGKTNLLRKVTNFTGSTITLDYNMPLSSYEKPNRDWTLASVEVEDPATPAGGGRTLTRFEYGTPNYNRFERMDFGYDSVITKQYDTEGGDTLYRYTVEVYENQNYTKRGRKTYDCLHDASGHKFVEHEYEAYVYHWQESLPVENEDCAGADLFVRDEVIRTNYYERLQLPKVVSQESRRFDNRRNVIRYTYEGNITHNREFFTAKIDYAKGLPHNLISLPVRIEVKDADSTLMQLRTSSYTDTGKLKQLVNYSTPYDSSICDFSYDHFGNLVSSEMPENVHHQRLRYSYQYDPLTRTYPVLVRNESLGYYSEAEYDLRFGKPTKTVDVNRNEMRYTYDDIGRLSTITAPYELDNNVNWTVRYGYVAHHYGVREIWTYNQNEPLFSWARTSHYDPQDTMNQLCTIVITDNLGRMLQTKKDAEINGHEGSICTGRVFYDCFGRTIRQYLPVEDTCQAYPTFNSSFGTGSHTTMKYDILDRQTYVHTPLGYVTTMAYGFDTCYGKWCLSTAATDPKSNTVTTLVGTLGQQLKQIAPGNTVTWFEYDALGRLLRSTDPDNISTYYTYDMAGRMVQRRHPDAGVDRYHYDAAGNMTSHINARTDSVIYKYNYNLLTDVEFPHYPANNVHYRYGTNANASINAVGKVIQQEDASGMQKFSYGKLGELTIHTRTFVLPFDTCSYTFSMHFSYDSWNRMQTMTYPDGEVVSYVYNKGGMLKSVTGEKNGVPYRYIDSIRYNKFELKDTVWYGNGTRACYAYDSLQRLSHLRSYDRFDSLMQDLSYTFDSVGNITNIANSAPMLPNGLGGTYSQCFSYDNLYRLTGSSGIWSGSDSLDYHTETEYHANGRIKRKQVTAKVLSNGHVSQINYDNGYYYDNLQQPNTLSRISAPEVVIPGISFRNGNDRSSSPVVHFSWDATGNMVSQDPAGDAGRRFLCWDEHNRLQGVVDKKYLSYYQYDANGDRTFKLTGKGELQNISGNWQYYYLLENATLYASPYLVATDKGYTKHYYAENERIASKIGGGGLTEFGHPLLRNKSFVKKMKANSTMMDKVLVGCLNAKYYEVKPVLQHLYDWQDSVQPEDNCYWYHPDHLGSSSWITHTNGHTVQHLHYLPWGEDFVDQKTTSFSSMYTFSAKEKDTETGYSYFGARYYSSDLSEWLSVDPMAAKYPSLSPYTYCADNPVKCVDPNGEENINFDDWYLNLKNGRIEHRDGSENLFREGLIRLAGDDAKVSDIEKALSDKGYDFRKDPAIPGGYVVYTEQAYKGWEMWCKIPYAAMTFSYEIPNANLLKKFEHGIKFVKNKIFSRGPRYYEYTKTVMSRMKDPSRYVPVSIVDDVIRYPVRTGPDPRGTSATMYYSTMRRNGKLYNIEILYDSEQNLIFHIMYSQKQLGPMPAIK